MMSNYFRQYITEFLMLSNQTLGYTCKCIRISILLMGKGYWAIFSHFCSTIGIFHENHGSWSTSELRLRLGLLNMFKPSSDFLLAVTRWCFFSGSFLLFMFHVCLYFTVVSLPCSLVITCWDRPDLLGLLCLLPIWWFRSGVVLDCTDSWS